MHTYECINENSTNNFKAVAALAVASETEWTNRQQEDGNKV